MAEQNGTRTRSEPMERLKAEAQGLIGALGDRAVSSVRGKVQGATGRISELKALGFYEGRPQKTAIVDAVLNVAAELGVPASHVAIAWIRQQGAQAATAYVPIIGPRSPAQLDDYLDALDLTLTLSESAHLDQVSAIRLGTPHELNAWSAGPIRGGDASVIDEPAIPPA